MKKQSLIVVCIVGFLLTLTIGYASFSDTIKINGTATAKGNFDMEFTKAQIVSEVGSTNTSAQISDDKNILKITVPKLEYPGAYSEILVTITNKGTIPAKLTSLQEEGLTTDQNVIVSYTGLQEVKDVVMNQNGTQTFSVKVMWDANSTSSSENVEFSIKLNYAQVTN